MPHQPKYPVYIPSKGRADRFLTGRFLMEDDVPFHVVVEPQEAGKYTSVVGADRVLVLPFANLGLGSIPARNWIWEHSKALGADRHWILDDNIYRIRRRLNAQRLPCAAGVAMHVTETFVDRYENIGIAGLNYQMFAPEDAPMPPYYLNTHVYSTLLIRNDLPYRWRGRYNEDTDLCLQVLAGGLCTVAMNAFLIEKIQTMQMKGGNSDHLYQGDGRLKMARSLERVWPYVVATKRRFNRPQHYIRNSWRNFDTPLKRRTDIDWSRLEGNNEFGMKLNQKAPIVKSAMLRSMRECYNAQDGKRT